MSRIYTAVCLLLLSGFFFFTPQVSAAPAPAAGNPHQAVDSWQPYTGAQQEEEAQGTQAFFEDFSDILASLAVFILTMFSMALGTEIAVDVTKQLFGLKSKPTARATIEQFEDLIPGNLEDLGISTTAQQQLEQHFRTLRSTLQPLATAEDLVVQLREGELKTAVENILNEAQVLSEGQTIETLIETQLRNALGNLGSNIGLDNIIVNSIMTKIRQTIAGVTLSDLQQGLQTAVNSLRAEIITAWMQQQLEQLETRGRNSIEAQFNDVLRPQLANFGFSAESERAIAEWFTKVLDDAENFSEHKTNLYLQSLNELLQGIERQRYLLQSPARKMWRRLHKADNFIGRTFRALEAAWNKMLGRTKMELEELMEYDPIENVASVARVILELDRQHKADADSRTRYIRTLSVGVGIILAYILQIDAAELLQGLIPVGTAKFLSTVLISEGSVILGVTFPQNLTAGIILAGLAASAGSSFWHARLGQLQSLRQTTEAAASAIEQFTTPEERRS